MSDRFSSGAMPGGSSTRRPTHSSNGPPRHSSARSQSPPAQEIIHPLKLGLNEIYTGATKRLRVTRKLLNGTTEAKVLEIVVMPGWKNGTKIRFPNSGDETGIGGEVQDLVFVVEEKDHPHFRRDGNDLHTTVKISLVDALTNPPYSTTLTSPLPTRTITALDGRRLPIPLPLGIIKPGKIIRIPGQGMPIRLQGGEVGKGDLVIQWEVVFPDTLTQEQRDAAWALKSA
jgi:DnaJ homolog subfamily B member 4